MKKIIFLLSLIILFSACQGEPLRARETGALTGGAIGAGLGAIIGNQTGNTGAGIAIGSALGAISGGLVGNEIDNQNAVLDEREGRISQNQKAIEENQRIIQDLRSRGADVRTTRRGVVVNLPDVLFEFSKASLRTDALRATREIAEVVQQYPNRKIAVEGHTDSVGTIPYNQKLSEDRAYSVANELVASGVSRARVAVRGYGETDPIATNSSPEGRARNRRVEVIIEN